MRPSSPYSARRNGVGHRGPRPPAAVPADDLHRRHLVAEATVEHEAGRRPRCPAPVDTGRSSPRSWASSASQPSRSLMPVRRAPSRVRAVARPHGQGCCGSFDSSASDHTASAAIHHGRSSDLDRRPTGRCRRPTRRAVTDDQHRSRRSATTDPPSDAQGRGGAGTRRLRPQRGEVRDERHGAVHLTGDGVAVACECVPPTSWDGVGTARTHHRSSSRHSHTASFVRSSGGRPRTVAASRPPQLVAAGDVVRRHTTSIDPWSPGRALRFRQAPAAARRSSSARRCLAAPGMAPPTSRATSAASSSTAIAAATRSCMVSSSARRTYRESV